MSFEPQERGHPTLTGGLLESETELRELSAEFVFAVPVSRTLLVTSPALGFLRVQLPPWELSPSWAPAMLAFHLSGPSQDCFSQVKSETQHHICQRRVQFPLFCLAAAKI